MARYLYKPYWPYGRSESHGSFRVTCGDKTIPSKTLGASTWLNLFKHSPIGLSVNVSDFMGENWSHQSPVMSSLLAQPTGATEGAKGAGRGG